MSEELVRTSLRDGILEIRLNINENNAMDLAGFAALDRALTESTANPAVRAVILASDREGFFCNGLQPQAVHGRPETEVRALIEHFFGVLRKLFFFPAPVVAEIGGHAMGYGAMLALCSDFRMMVDKKARICYPEVNLGIGLPVFVTSILENLVGARAARDLLFFGRALKAEEARELGLVDELHEAAALSAASQAQAKKLAGLSASAVRAIKESLRWPYADRLDAILAKDLGATLALLQSADAREGFSALLEKRRPKFG